MADPEAAPTSDERPKLSWKEGLYLVGPDPLTSPYYSSGALIVAGVGYATPLFQIGLYGLLFLLAPLYIEAVLLTLSNGGTYVMTRYALSRLGKWAVLAAAVVGVVISFSYVATAIVSLLSYSDYVMSLVSREGGGTAAAIGLSAIPAAVFGIWVMPGQWRKTAWTVVVTSLLALAFSTVFPAGVVVMLAPLLLLFSLNNFGLKESVQVSKTIFLINLVVMGVTIVAALLYLLIHGGHYSHLLDGVQLPEPDPSHASHSVTSLPGFRTLSVALIPAALGSSILGASGVESVMNIPEELERPRTDVRRIYRWMLSILLAIGGSLAILVFLVLSPEQLVGASGYLLAVLGKTSVAGVTGLPVAGDIWNIVIVANAALMLIGATNTGFAGARGLWVTMARDNLLPRSVLNLNERGAFHRIHLLMLVAIFLLCYQGGADVEILERWYGATFGLVMFSGVVAFVLLRRYKGADRRLYVAPFNVNWRGTQVPIAAFIGIAFLAFALLGLYTRYAEQIMDLRALLASVGLMIGAVVLGYNHRTLIRRAYRYFQRTIESEENDVIEAEGRTILVAVGSVRTGALIRRAIEVARAQSRTTGKPYRQVVVFHMTRAVRQEYVYRVRRDSIRPAGIEGNLVRIFTEMTEVAPPEMDMFLALVPNKDPSRDTLSAAMDELVDFHERHAFHGHIVMIGEYGVKPEDVAALQERFEGSTLVTVPA
jgi:amino acid transporter